MYLQKLARFLQDGYKSCKILARKMEELCIPLQDFLQYSSKILNFIIRVILKLFIQLVLNHSLSCCSNIYFPLQNANGVKFTSFSLNIWIESLTHRWSKDNVLNANYERVVVRQRKPIYITC